VKSFVKLDSPPDFLVKPRLLGVLYLFRNDFLSERRRTTTGQTARVSSSLDETVRTDGRRMTFSSIVRGIEVYVGLDKARSEEHVEGDCRIDCSESDWYGGEMGTWCLRDQKSDLPEGTRSDGGRYIYPYRRPSPNVLIRELDLNLTTKGTPELSPHLVESGLSRSTTSSRPSAGSRRRIPRGKGFPRGFPLLSDQRGSH
jgi:hypothetical protein